MNVAVTDPLEQQGLLAFDDEELRAAGAAAAAALQSSLSAASKPLDGSGSPTGKELSGVSAVLLGALQQGLLYVVAVSRNCTGGSHKQH